MSPYFGPLSAEHPDLQSLSTDQAFTAICREIRHSIRQIAPPKPPVCPPHRRGHNERGPQLWFEPNGQLNLGRWYQTCKTCSDPTIIRFTTKCLNPGLITGQSAMGRLIRVYNEILSFPGDDKDDEVSIASTDDDSNDHNNSHSDDYMPAAACSIMQKRGRPSTAATRVVKQRQSNPPPADPAPSTLPLALRRGRRPAPFPILSPLYEMFNF
ncbi:hypothetical protein BYT27DRAFT_7110679 [Phlegmacium glaucopus]|nr:hypothetical protein BYT27DRAFT_7110679 [Phlegmacium glaucopus]